MARVPEWADCAAIVDAGAELTTLQQLVYDHERGWQARAALEKGK